jgi:hypothetical protein
MRLGCAVVSALAVVLGGCATTQYPGVGAAPDEPVGYRYYDNQHPNWVNNPSPEAVANAQRGTWLWPPAVGIIR